MDTCDPVVVALNSVSVAISPPQDFSRRKQIQQRFTEYTRSIMSRSAVIEELIAQEEKDDILNWLDSL